MKTKVNNKILSLIKADISESSFVYLNDMLSEVDGLFKELFACSDSCEMSSHIYGTLTNGGKRLRPLLLSLSSKFGDANDEEIIKLMSTIELIHTASLVHDDIVDKSSMRRNQPTINSEKGDAYAARCGFEMIATSLELLSDCDKDEILDIIANIPMQMCYGELEQFDVEFSCNSLTEDNYYARIKQKTASLIQGSCLIGALSSSVDKNILSALSDYGLAIGQLFQIRDDLLDYENTPIDGKPISQDIERGIYTLPIIFTLNTLSADSKYEAEHKKFLFVLEKRKKTNTEIQYIIDTTRSMGGIDYARKVVKNEAAKALSSLKALPKSDYREVLASIVNLLAS